MKSLISSAMHCNRRSIASHAAWCLLIVTSIIFVGCTKDSMKPADLANQTQLSNLPVSEAAFFNLYSGLSRQTLWELQQARAATAKYNNVDNAIKDGYVDIAVDVEHMGHHYMKPSIVDGTFDITQPEILVYNRNERGVQQLVAVEYAVPLSFAMPEGFTGSSDVWKGDSGFPFWLVHAWVWSYNPDGVFNWTNPTVDLH
jgi:hypothetical protein